MKKIVINPIGFVENKVKKPRFGNFSEEVSEIVLDKNFSAGLEGINDYSHIIVVYWMDKVKEYVVSHRPQGNQEVPIVGIFSCRCQARPNPIGITTVEMLGRKENRVKVKGLDVINGTPVLDIKPYWPQYDEAKSAKIPDWVRKLKF